MNYAYQYNRSMEHPEIFWMEQAQELHWFEAPRTILSKNDKGLYRWFDDGLINMSYLCLDYHVHRGRGDQKALIWDSPVTGQQYSYTYMELLEEVCRTAGALEALGVRMGDTVVIYMPMIPEAAIAMLACARIGAIHSVVFGGFAPHELAIRIEDVAPKLVLTASCGIEVDRIIPYKPLVDQAIAESNWKPERVVVYQREEHRAELNSLDLDWKEWLEGARSRDVVWVPSNHPLYVLYTSGTTGKPKGIVRDTGGYAVALKYSMQHVYGAEAGDVFWAASDVGWVVGHSYMIYGPLIQGCTTVLYEGKPVKTPDAGAFWRVVAEHEVSIMFTAPTAIRAMKKEDPEGAMAKKYGLSSLRYLFLAGERCDVATLQWAEGITGKPVIDHWWQTESGWPMLGIMMGLEPKPVKPGSAGMPVCGYAISILHEDATPCKPGEEGLVAVALPLPPGTLPGLWKNEEGFIASYLQALPGYYLTGDGGYYDEDGYYYITGRVDDVINVAGHRLSTGEMEEMVSAYPSVAECAVIGIADELRGQRPLALLVLKDGVVADEAALENELVQLIRNQIGAVAYFRNAVIVQRLPKTRSGKILRKTMRKIADGVDYVLPSTIDDPAIVDEIRSALSRRKIGLAFETLAALT